MIVGIATRGRPLILGETIADLARQSRPADRIVVSYAEQADIGDAARHFPQVCFVPAELGLTRQRNAILEQAQDADVLLFLDDDFYLDRDYLSVLEQLFAEQQEVAVATGRVLADGINGAGLASAEARAMLAGGREAAADVASAPVFNAYGCNMALRMSPVRQHGLRFDELLPLYGWWEDVDFSRQMARYGSVVLLTTAVGVHLGAKSGRTSGVRLGYSQVANPIYLARKGTVPWSHALPNIWLRVLKNVVKSLAPEPYVDRRGRLRGNLIACRELVTGKLCPLRALDL
ncbi:MAG TPA: glycosyltransferase [Acidobacteriaceae bacterium]